MFQQGRKYSEQKFKNLGAQSLTLESITNAITSGRDEALESLKLKGKESVTTAETQQAFEQGRKKELERIQAISSNLITPDEIKQILLDIKLKIKLETVSAIKESLEFKEIYKHSIEAAYISLLREIEIESLDRQIVNKAIFCLHFTECLFTQDNITRCIKYASNYVGTTYDHEICP